MFDKNMRFDSTANTAPTNWMKFGSRDRACGFYFAGKCRGASIKLIAAAVGIDRRTAQKLLSNSDAYKDIKEEFNKLGEQVFGQRYFNEDVANALIAAKTRPAVKS